MLQAITLTGEHVRLEPLSHEHHDGLCAAISDGRLWELFVTSVPVLGDVKEFIDKALRERNAGASLAFASVNAVTGEVIGSTRFMNVDLANRRLEIGHTFLAKSYQRSAMNTEAKLLMLTHAFEVVSVNRVEFRTDYLNTKSRQAILRLGAKEEAVLRSHVVMADERVRDTSLYSIIKNEWPGVRQNLEFRLR